MSQAAEPLLELDRDEEHRWWLFERNAIERGLGQLEQLKAKALRRKRRALTDPEFAREEAARLTRDREIWLDPDERDVEPLRRLGRFVVVPDERGMIPDDPALVALYYQRRANYHAQVIADYQRRLAIARGKTWVLQAHHWRLAPVLALRPRSRSREARPRARARTRGSRTSRGRPRRSSDDDDIARGEAPA